ncbi:MAG: VPS10 domain-containing protein [Vulcanimicrobiaceae bacterium]
MTWRSIGPGEPGRVTAVAGSATNDKLYYLGAAGGGVWKSVNGGRTWSPVFDEQSVASIGAIALDPTDDTTVWVGTGEDNPRNDVSYGDGVYKSTDGGATWTNVGLRGTKYISRILIDPRNHNHVIVGAQGDIFADSTERGVYVTDDGGKTWRRTLYAGLKSGISDLALDPHHPDTVYAGLWQFRRYPWTFESGGLDDGLYRSTDGGSTWRKLQGGGLPTDMMGRIGIAVAPSNGNRVYALIQSKQGVLWRSDDGGTSWTMVSSDTLVDERPFYFSHIETDPTDPDRVYALSVLMSVSKDGGKSFTRIDNQNGDHHELWIAPNDPSRMIVAADGQFSLTVDGGTTWFSSENLPIGQAYRVALSRENPYWVCAGFQDNPAWCAPSNSQEPYGILNKNWIWTAGGDGEWSVPDPLDPNLIWADSNNGVLVFTNKATRDAWVVTPHLQDSKEQFDNRLAHYRYNWESPIAFAPWDGHVAWFGGNHVFATSDRGMHWSTISPDLTRNDKHHQVPPGGAITYDVSGAEEFDTILDIEGSTVKKNEIWVGTDDGLVQLTRDGGKHWKNVTPPGGPRDGRYATVAPSPLIDGTAYAVNDGHYAADNAPYVFATHDFGEHWTSIASGLPSNEWARTIRPDIRNKDVLYLGTEENIWISFDAGGSWQLLKNDLPAASIRDIRIQPDFDDLVIATHGRSIYVMDDVTPLQDFKRAQAAGVWLFKPRTSYEYNQRSDTEFVGTKFAASNPPLGVPISYYQSAPAKSPPKLDILDASGRTIKTIQGTSNLDDKVVSNVPNETGINRYVWDFSIDGPTKWKGATPDYQTSDSGPAVPPGTYAVRLTLGDKVLQQRVRVMADPRTIETQTELVASFRYATHCTSQLSLVDTMLNNLDDEAASLGAASARAANLGDAALNGRLADALVAEKRVHAHLTADYREPEDEVRAPGALRDDLFLNCYEAVATPAYLDLQRDIDASFRKGIDLYNAFAGTIADVNAVLTSAKEAPLPIVQKIGIGAVQKVR